MYNSWYLFSCSNKAVFCWPLYVNYEQKTPSYNILIVHVYIKVLLLQGYGSWTLQTAHTNSFKYWKTSFGWAASVNFSRTQAGNYRQKPVEELAQDAFKFAGKFVYFEIAVGTFSLKLRIFVFIGGVNTLYEHSMAIKLKLVRYYLQQI